MKNPINFLLLVNYSVMNRHDQRLNSSLAMLIVASPGSLGELWVIIQGVGVGQSKRPGMLSLGSYLIAGLPLEQLQKTSRSFFLTYGMVYGAVIWKEIICEHFAG
ncbi:MAG: hypothetical protein JXB07_01605 [Anaerolineae bacterium]|nr:hypothetical protein [Anaerolineae bacterium]